MAKASASPSKEILEAALQGLETQRQKLDEQISQVRSMMGQSSPRSAKRAGSEGGESAATSNQSGRRKRVLSPEARKRIAAAQKKRWASFRKNQA
jgi:peptidoglycan hydrolase CwlO-like protein